MKLKVLVSALLILIAVFVYLLISGEFSQIGRETVQVNAYVADVTPLYVRRFGYIRSSKQSVKCIFYNNGSKYYCQFINGERSKDTYFKGDSVRLILDKNDFSDVLDQMLIYSAPRKSSSQIKSRSAETTITDPLDLWCELLENPDGSNFQVHFRRFNDLLDKGEIQYPLIECFSDCDDIELIDKELLLIEGEPSTFNALSDSVFSLMKSGNVLRKHREFSRLDNAGIERSFSYSHVELKFTNEKEDLVQEALLQIKMGIDRYRDNLARNWYDKPFTKLDSLDQNFIYSNTKFKTFLFNTSKW